jgi:hypothetical protein
MVSCLLPVFNEISDFSPTGLVTQAGRKLAPEEPVGRSFENVALCHKKSLLFCAGRSAVKGTERKRRHFESLHYYYYVRSASLAGLRTQPPPSRHPAVATLFSCVFYNHFLLDSTPAQYLIFPYNHTLFQVFVIATPHLAKARCG